MISCGLTRYLLYSVLAVVLSALISAINISVLNATQEELLTFISKVLIQRSYYETTSEAFPTLSEKSTEFDNQKISNIYSVIKSIYFVGGIIGALLNGYVGDRFGRKKCLIWNNGFIYFAVIFIGLSKRFRSFEMLTIGQLLIGINSGLNTCLAPIYLTEISPIRNRGLFGSVYILSTSLGTIFFHILIVITSVDNWIVMFSSMIIPSVLMLLMLSKCEESPKYLFIINRDEISAQNVLIILRENSEISNELYELKVEYQSIERNSRFTIYDLLTNTKIAIALSLSIVTILSQQFTGTKAILYFSANIFGTAGLSSIAASYTGLVLLLLSSLITLISVFLVDKFGRRTLLLIGLLGMFCTLIFLTFCLALKYSLHFVSYLSILTLFAFMACFSCGPSFIPNFLFAELFRTDSRSVGTTISVTTIFSANLINDLCFLPLEEALSGYVFTVFSILTLIFWIIIYKKVPETNGKTVEDIVREI